MSGLGAMCGLSPAIMAHEFACEELYQPIRSGIELTA